MPKPVALIGYSGHAYVACDILRAMQRSILGYCELAPKTSNPYNLTYLGNEQAETTLKKIKGNDYFIAVGDNRLRQKIQTHLSEYLGYDPISIVDPRAIISPTATIGAGSMIGTGSIINAAARLGKGTICNTAAIVEHECQIGDFVHIAPNTTLCGNVHVGDFSLIGAASVVIPNQQIGASVVVGAGAVVVHNISDNEKVVGNPIRRL